MEQPPEGAIARVGHFRDIATGASAASDSYGGIPIFAHRGLHAFAAAEMGRLGLVVPGQLALDVACGAGAMSQRLGEAGMRVVGLDALPENFAATASGVSNRRADLNGRFEEAVDGPADLVVAMEIVEHLENPRAFLRSCFACLRPGGTLFLTTPNIDSTYSAVSLLLKGHFARFDDGYLARDGHIMPVCRHQLLAAAADAGFSLLAEGGHGRDGLSPRAWPKFWALLETARRIRRAPAVREAAISSYAFRRPA